MTEEEAFGVLVRIMFDYGLRDLFKPGFEALHLRFYQLDRLTEVGRDEGSLFELPPAYPPVSIHMPGYHWYASQVWLL